LRTQFIGKEIASEKERRLRTIKKHKTSIASEKSSFVTAKSSGRGTTPIKQRLKHEHKLMGTMLSATKSDYFEGGRNSQLKQP